MVSPVVFLFPLLAIHFILFIVNTTSIDFPNYMSTFGPMSQSTNQILSKGLSSSLQRRWLMAFSGLLYPRSIRFLLSLTTLIIGSNQTERLNERMNNPETAFLKLIYVIHMLIRHRLQFRGTALAMVCSSSVTRDHLRQPFCWSKLFLKYFLKLF